MVKDTNSLKKLKFFSKFTDDGIKAVGEIISEVDYIAGKQIFTEGEEGHTLYIILDGEVKVTKKDHQGNDQVLTLLKDGDIFGEMSFLDERPHSATITAIKNSRIYQIEKPEFDRFVDKHPKAAYKVMKNIVFQVDSIVRRMNAAHVDMISYMFGRSRF